MYVQKIQWFPVPPPFLEDCARWSEGLQGFFFLGKIIGSWSYFLPDSSSRPSEKKGSSLVQDKLCWWINGGAFKPGLKLPRATSDGEERDLPVPLGRARSSSWSLAWLVECSSVWDLGTGLLMPDWCLVKYGLHFGNREWNLRIGLLYSRDGDTSYYVFISPFRLSLKFLYSADSAAYFNSL